MTKPLINPRRLLNEAISEPPTEIVNFRALRDLLLALIEKLFQDSNETKMNQTIKETKKKDDSNELFESLSPSSRNQSDRSDNSNARSLLNQIIDCINSIDETDGRDDNDTGRNGNETERIAIKEMITLQVIDFITNSLKESGQLNQEVNDGVMHEDESGMEPDSTMDQRKSDAIQSDDIEEVLIKDEPVTIETISNEEAIPEPVGLKNKRNHKVNVPSMILVSAASQPDEIISSIVEEEPESVVFNRQDENIETGASFDNGAIGVEMNDSIEAVVDEESARDLSWRTDSHDRGMEMTKTIDVDVSDHVKPVEGKRRMVTFDEDAIPPSTSVSSGRDELDKMDSKIDSVLNQIESFVADTLNNVKNLKKKIITLEQSSTAKNKQIEEEIAELRDELNKHRISSQEAVNGLRNEMNYRNNKVTDVRSQVRAELARIRNRNGNRQRNLLKGKCGCNALSNDYRCMCRRPRECKNGKNLRKVSPVCFCCCSYIQGTNGENSNRTNCNCCQTTSNEKHE